ncbi:MAG: type II secretion system F family protein [Candidatus Goldbacteria bacterium]|nr:type II secretion system F family protein [Candidatus Goldiibacteriota bacterium]
MGLLAALFIGVCAAFFMYAAGMITERRSAVLQITAGRKLTVSGRIIEFASYLKSGILKFNSKFSGVSRYIKINSVLQKLDLDKKYSTVSFIYTEEIAALCVFTLILAVFGDIYFAVFFGICAFFIPSMILNSKLRKKNDSIFKELPDALDIICAFIEGGLSVSRAVCRYPEKTKGVFAGEIAMAAKKMKLGKSFQEVMSELEERIDVKEVSSALSAFIRADKSGGNVRDIVRAQADEARKKRFMQMKKKAHEAPVKLLFPLMVFIFPVIFMVLFGPIIIKLMSGL